LTHSTRNRHMGVTKQKRGIHGIEQNFMTPCF